MRPHFLWMMLHRCADCRRRMILTSYERCDPCFAAAIRRLDARSVVEHRAVGGDREYSRAVIQEFSSDYLPMTQRFTEVYEPRLAAGGGDFGGAGAAGSWQDDSKPAGSCDGGSDGGLSSSDSSSSCGGSNDP